MSVMTSRPQTSSQRSQAKLLASGKNNKRKLPSNAEELQSGTAIVRQLGPSSRSTSQPAVDRSTSHRPIDPNGVIPPPAKKFRAGSQPPSTVNGSGPSAAHPESGPSTTRSFGRTPEIEEDVRAMEDEADRLRRDARARSLDPSLKQDFHAPPRPPVQKPSGSRKPRIVDTTQPLPPSHTESPMIAKNKRLREGAMNAIRAESQEPESEPDRGRRTSVNGSGNGRGHRRTSSVNGRGKRISQSFEATGLLSHPHNSISESSFYKHIDPELPETERLRLLLTWCTSRAAHSYASVSGTKLPPLSAEETSVLQKVQENIQRVLADKQIDLSTANLQSQPSGSRANEQNVSNRRYEAQYSNEIRSMEQEHEVWKKINYYYESYFKKEQVLLDKRKSDISQRQSLSAKAKGKQKASDDDNQEDWNWLPSEHVLPESQHSGFSLAKSVLGLQSTPSGALKRVSTRTRIGREEAEARLQKEYSELAFNLDTLHTYVNAARATTRAAEAELDQRFRLLNLALDARSGDLPDSSRTGSASAAAQIVNSYVAPMPHAPPRRANDPHDLFRALARVDSARPPGQIGDGARRAAREVHRMEENGIVGSSERKLTEVPPTPKKAPGTPRRGNTPGRGTTPGR
ncbi:hypothetical protein GYMLUDRAFT_221700 [Collybiopsis luxurians FD-317 M1]|uniref:Uncharacterized protein n=1 Tax=Collybiopsis luxurians FD-317 M1 TaxID=944289 RepID=A0A0D0C641_9AGAR|nr:hypothetical protein GYMLUDRAFT_221700 [Collybiopsis luxurians FD-317 M1]